ncbi:MAG: PKD domain-containing protein [Chitinophagaceae bacterium]
MDKGRKFISKLIILLPFFTYGQTVDFTFSTSNNLYCNPQLVTFTQNCTGAPDGFIWRFGNGVSANQSIASTTYSNPGTYFVTLIAIYADVAISTTKPITINPTPFISISADRNNLCQPGIVNFTASGSPFISSFEWNFGDGSPVLITSTNAASHLFSSYNSFVVTVKGITLAGCSSIATDTVKVERFSITDAGIDPPGGCIPATIVLNVIPDPPQGDPPVNFTWNFGDGSPVANTTVPDVSHIYTITTPITTASVTVATASGCTSQYIYPLFGFGIPPVNPVAVTDDGRTTYCASETIRFNSSATNANYFVWDYGDGSNDSISSPTTTHRYRSLGNKRVIMTPYFNGCAGVEKDTIDLTIIGVVADYTFHNLCSARNHFVYDNLSLGNISSFRWTFSDIPGSPDIVNYNTTHNFPANGSFTTQLYLYDSTTGCNDSLLTNQYTATPVFTSSRSKVCKDSIIVYTVLNPYPPNSGYVYEYHVDGPIIAHSIYPELILKPDLRGVFNEFVIIDGPGNNTCNDTLYLPGPTTVGGPVLDFSMPDLSCFLNNSFPVVNNSFPFFATDPIVTWEWDFGDNTFSNLKDPPPHSYAIPGAFKMFFKVTDINSCAQIDSMIVRVHPTPEIYVLPRIDTICSGDSLQLLAFTIDNLQWTTNYNISCLTCDTVRINPATSTNYVAQATNGFGCINSDTAKIKVYEPFDLQVSPADTAFCPPGRVQYYTNLNGIFNWSPSSWLNASGIRNPVSTPDSSVTYRIILNDSGSCFADTAFASILVYTIPTVNAGSDQIVPFYNSFTFNPAYSSDVVSYHWSPPVNALSCTSCPVVSGVASESAKYTIDVTTADGCKAKDDVMVIVVCNKANLNLPSAFTPNNDGLNDHFYPLTRGYKMINKFVVYDRWANKVFERYNFLPNTPLLGWNGTTKDKQPSGSNVFVWMIEATCDLGEKVESKGIVTLIR